jgi:hypothetical protein
MYLMELAARGLDEDLTPAVGIAELHTKQAVRYLRQALASHDHEIRRVGSKCSH